MCIRDRISRITPSSCAHAPACSVHREQPAGAPTHISSHAAHRAVCTHERLQQSALATCTKRERTREPQPAQ
eukprot:312615-Alexandrium_andersonii.AAC.1